MKETEPHTQKTWCITRNPHGREFIEIDHRAVRASIALEGAHIVECTPVGQPPLLWMSPVDPQQPGKPLRGGVPVCWPWFADERPGPAHGIARTSQWTLKEVVSTDDEVHVHLELDSDEILRQLPNEHWTLEAHFTLGKSLQVELTTRNTGAVGQRLSQALHTYLPVEDIRQVRVHGLEAAPYEDKLTDRTEAAAQQCLEFAGEVDRIYFDHAGPIQVTDGNGLALTILREGSRSVVVWNPWTEKSRRLSQFPDDGFLGMLCIEAANAGPDSVLLQPGESHRLYTQISRAEPDGR
jgi:glucose-6-phosphate 1-epimerase